MRLVVTAAVLAAVLLGGCTPSRGKTVYDKPGIGDAQKASDEAAARPPRERAEVTAQDGCGAGRRQKNTREIGWVARYFCADSI